MVLSSSWNLHPTGEPHENCICGLLGSGAGEGTRTLDINLGKVALYQLSYTRIPFFEDMIQTRDRQSEIIRKKETRTFLTPHLYQKQHTFGF